MLLRQIGDLVRTAWNRIWFAPCDPLPGAVFRIGVGLLYFVMFLCLAPNWLRFYGPAGILSLGRPIPYEYGWEDPWTIFYWIDGAFAYYCVLAVALLASVTMTLGLYTRASTIVLFLLQVSMVHRMRYVVNGEDLVLRMLLFYACFARLGDCLSLDAWLRGKKKQQGGALKSRAPAQIWALRLMQINLVAIYAFSLPVKLRSDPAWLNGDLMYFVLVNKTWSRWPWPSLAARGPLSDVMTYMALITEGAFPILAWFRSFRLPMTLAVMFFHTTIAIMLKNVTFFSLAMVCGFTVFLPGEALRKLLSKAGVHESLLRADA